MRASYRSRCGRGFVAVCWLLLLATGGCKFLSDEFTWLDRANPAAVAVPDAPQSGVVDRN